MKPHIVGKTFGYLNVVEATSERDHRGAIIYRCLCKCGKEKFTISCLLTNGNVKSCGCLRKEKPSRFSHLMSNSREYRIWYDMKRRCTNPKNKSFSYYGGRGITYCKDWEKFENFYKDMGNCPENYTLDRVNANGNYEPKNCRWTDRKTQSRNKRNNHLLTFNGKTMCMSEWAEEIGISRDCLKDRIYRGWSLEKALTKEIKQ